MEDNFFTLRLQRGYAINASKARAALTNETRVFLENELLRSGDPVSLDNEFALVRSALCGDDGALDHVAHFGCLFRLDRFGVIPEIEIVHVPIVEPHPRVMGMIDTFSRPWFEGKAAGDDRAGCGAQRIKYRLGEGCRPDVGSKGLPVDGNVDAAPSFIDDHFDALAGSTLFCGHAKNDKQRCNGSSKVPYTCG